MPDENVKEKLKKIVDEFHTLFTKQAEKPIGTSEQLDTIKYETIRTLLQKTNTTSAFLFLLIAKSGSPEREYLLFKQALAVYDKRKSTRQINAQQTMADKKFK